LSELQKRPSREVAPLSPPNVLKLVAFEPNFYRKGLTMGQLESLLIYLLIGLIAGWLAGQIMKGSGFGLGGDLAVGVAGAVIGGYLFGGIIPVGGILGSILCATLGACLLLFIIKLIRRR